MNSHLIEILIRNYIAQFFLTCFYSSVILFLSFFLLDPRRPHLLVLLQKS